MAPSQWDFSTLYLSIFLTNRLIFYFNFWHINRHEWNKQGSLTCFLKKIIIWGNGPFWAQKLCILIILDPLEEFFKNFAQWKGLIGRWIGRFGGIWLWAWSNWARSLLIESLNLTGHDFFHDYYWILKQSGYD